MLTRGDVLGGRYRLDEPIATGGMGEVWRATDVTLGRTVALKVLRTALLSDPVFDARFRAEARNLAALSHPNVVNIYDYGRSQVPEGDATYLVMAYVAGQPLSALIPQSGGMPVDSTLSVLAQAADALHAAHAHGIVHRDVKPANLLVRPNGTVVLVDFGVARSPAMSTATTGNQVLGTALYMAPEQASGRGVSPATDIYALGAVGYHCLSGLPPFVGESPIEVALRHVSEPTPPLPQSIPPAVRSLVLRALAKDPADRYPDAAAFAASARAAARATTGRTTVLVPPPRPAPATAAATPPTDPPTLAELPVTHRVPAAYPGSPADRAHAGRGRQWVAALACVLAIGLLVGVVGLLLQTGQRAGGGPAPADRPAPGQPATAGTGAPPTTAPPPPSVIDPANPAPTGSASALPGAPGAPAPSTTTAKPPASTPPPAPSQPAPTTTGPATSAPPSPPASSVPTADTGATTGPSVAAVPGGSGSGSASGSGTSSATAPQTRTASGSGSASTSGSASASGSGSASATSTVSNSDSPSASSNSPSNPAR